VTDRHESSCSVHNAPAYEPGPCDCKYREQNETLKAYGAKLFDCTHCGKEFMSLDVGGDPICLPCYAEACKNAYAPNEALDKAVEACMMERAGRE